MSAREMANYPTLDLQNSIKDTPKQQSTYPRSIILLQSFSAAELVCLRACWETSCDQGLFRQSNRNGSTNLLLADNVDRAVVTVDNVFNNRHPQAESANN